MTQDNANDFANRMYEQINLDEILGSRISPLGEKMRSPDPCINPYVSLTDIAKEKGTASSGHLIQSWLRSNTTTDYLKYWGKTQYKVSGRCMRKVNQTCSLDKSNIDTDGVDNGHTSYGTEDIPWQRRRNNGSPGDCYDVQDVAVPRVYDGAGEGLSDVPT